MFDLKMELLFSQIELLEKSNNEHKQQILESEDDMVKRNRVESLNAFIKMQAFDPNRKIPETLIDAFVERIIYDKGVFSWYLKPKVGNASFDIDTSGWKKSMLKGDLQKPDDGSTGGYQQ